MIDHLSLSVANATKSKAFYARVLEPLGYKLISEDAASFGIGQEGGSTLWVAQGKPQQPIAHIALRARSRAEVNAFHKNALKAGAADNGAPGLRPNYAANYYAAFVLDPDGNNLEAVYFGE